MAHLFRRLLCPIFLLLFAIIALRLHGQTDSLVKPPVVSVAADGSVIVPSQIVPVSSLLSPEAKAYVAQHLKDMQDPTATYTEKGIPRFMVPYLAQQRSAFPVTEQDTRIGGVHVVVFTPKSGVPSRNSKRVLLNLHGGGFSGCWPGCSLLESMPVASLGGFKVVSVDYREGPENHFPAASEDVAKVYAALLKEYRPRNIGVYGCSAGGSLTAMSLAWFQKHGLPTPGAVGIFCAGAGSFAGGDAPYTTLPLGEARMPVGQGQSLSQLGYFKDTNPDDPLIAPVRYPEILAKFPPTLLITATRDFALSNALNTNIALTKAGVDTHLYVWDGLFHGFFYNASVPESMDAFQIICKFFEKNLGN